MEANVVTETDAVLTGLYTASKYYSTIHFFMLPFIQYVHSVKVLQHANLTKPNKHCVLTPLPLKR